MEGKKKCAKFDHITQWEHSTFVYAYFNNILVVKNSKNYYN